MKSRRSRRDFEDMKHSSIEISEDSQSTAEVIEAAHILIQLYHDRKGLFLQWGAKRSRYEQNPFHTSATPASRLNSKKVIAKKRPRERAPKKLTKPELKEMVDKLSLEHSILIKEAEQMRKKYQGLKDCNFNLNSQLALCLDQRQEQNMPYTYRPSSSHSDTRQKTETTTSCDNFQRCDEHANFEIFSGSSALVWAYDKLHRRGRPMYACSPEFSVVFEKDSTIPTKDTAC